MPYTPAVVSGAPLPAPSGAPSVAPTAPVDVLPDAEKAIATELKNALNGKKAEEAGKAIEKINAEYSVKKLNAEDKIKKADLITKELAGTGKKVEYDPATHLLVVKDATPPPPASKDITDIREVKSLADLFKWFLNVLKEMRATCPRNAGLLNYEKIVDMKVEQGMLKVEQLDVERQIKEEEAKTVKDAAKIAELKKKLAENLAKQKELETRLAMAEMNKKAYEDFRRMYGSDPNLSVRPGYDACGNLYWEGKPGAQPSRVQSQLSNVAGRCRAAGYRCCPSRPSCYSPMYVNVINSPGATVTVQRGGIIKGSAESSASSSSSTTKVDDREILRRGPRGPYAPGVYPRGYGPSRGV